VKRLLLTSIACAALLGFGASEAMACTCSGERPIKLLNQSDGAFIGKLLRQLADHPSADLHVGDVSHPDWIAGHHPYDGVGHLIVVDDAQWLDLASATLRSSCSLTSESCRSMGSVSTCSVSGLTR
jgi:hypothetical protein